MARVRAAGEQHLGYDEHVVVLEMKERGRNGTGARKEGRARVLLAMYHRKRRMWAGYLEGLGQRMASSPYSNGIRGSGRRHQPDSVRTI